MRRGMSRAVLLLALMGGMPLVMAGPSSPEPEPEPEPEPDLLRARLAPRAVAGPYLEGGPPAPPGGVVELGATSADGRAAGSRARRRWKLRRRGR